MQESSDFRFTFSKNERLKSKQIISLLFAEGKRIKAFPLRIFYKKIPEHNSISPSKVAFTVSKKKFKRTVDRNRIKRLMREAFRLEKHQINHHLNDFKREYLAIVVIYVGQNIPSYQTIHEATKKMLDRLIKELVPK